MNISVLGIDLAKNTFQLHGVNAQGKVMLKKSLSREKLAEFIANLPPCLIGMEACSSSNYWARKFKQYGHDVKLISPQFVKPYVKSNKNDANDAEAICEAVTRPHMRFVAAKTMEQQDIQALHRIRSGFIQRRTALVNQIRGLLGEYGIVIAKSIASVRKHLPTILEDATNELTDLTRELFSDLYQQLIELDKQIMMYNKKVEQLCENSDLCQRIKKIPGIGPLSATAIVAAVGDAKLFKNGRQMAAWLGLVPRQYSTGGRQVLLGISKRGDSYLRCLLIHGARAVVTCSKHKVNTLNNWLKKLVEKKGMNKACVALANKNARIIWALMSKGNEYKSA